MGDTRAHPVADIYEYGRSEDVHAAERCAVVSQRLGDAVPGEMMAHVEVPVTHRRLKDADPLSVQPLRRLQVPQGVLRGRHHMSGSADGARSSQLV